MQNLKISVITPSFNSSEHIERAIKSVIKQNYNNFEHIIVDNCSTDGTIEILKKYKHLTWVSESDSGQSNAMNRGFDLSTGDLIVYLNCDDFFEECIFDFVSKTFNKNPNIDILIGNGYVHLLNGKVCKIVPKIGFNNFIHFYKGWEKIGNDALQSYFPNNPVQYFYKRKVQENIKFNENNHYTMDLEFLIDCSVKYKNSIVYVDKIFGHYVLQENAKSIQAQQKEEYWQDKNFEFIDKYFYNLSELSEYKKERKKYFEKRIKNIKNSVNNILIYSPVPIYPAYQGNRRRILEISRYLKSLGYNLYLIIYGSEWIKGVNYEDVKNQYNDLFVDVYNIPKRKNHKKLFGKNIHIDDSYEKGLGEYVRNLCIKNNIDIHIQNYIFQSKILDYIPENILKIIDTHDKFKDKYKIANWYSYDEKNEAAGISRADIVWAIQENEKKYFENITNKKVVTIGHLTKESFLELNYTQLNTLGILSSGHIRDLVSVEKFINKFIEHNKNNKLKLKVCGLVCKQLYQKYDHPDIEYLFLVDDIKDFYKSIDLCVIPPEDGSGLKIKSVEALSYGIPIISTEHGFEGIGSDSKFHDASDVDELFHYIHEISSNPVILNDLQNISKNVYHYYTTNVKKEISKYINNYEYVKSFNDKDIYIRQSAKYMLTRKKIFSYFKKILNLNKISDH